LRFVARCRDVVGFVGELSLSLLLVVLLVVAVAPCLPVVLLDEHIPPAWRAPIAYAVSCWCLLYGLGIIAGVVNVTWRGESRHELLAPTAWKGFEWLFLTFLGIVLLFGGTYWMLDRLCPGRCFSTQGGGPITWLYFSIITIATVGYGDINPTSSLSRLLVSIEVLEGILLLVTSVGVLASLRSEELLRGHPNARRTFLEIWDRYCETRDKYGPGCIEEIAATIEAAQASCTLFLSDESFQQGFFAWLSRDSYAQLHRFAVKTRDGRVLALSIPDGPLMEIVREFSANGHWYRWWNSADPNAYEVTEAGFVRIYESAAAAGVVAALSPMPPAYSPIGGKEPTPSVAVRRLQWREPVYLTPEDFAARILGFVRRYLA
jgi:hypothetical protein